MVVCAAVVTAALCGHRWWWWWWRCWCLVGVDGERGSKRAQGSHVQGDVKAAGAAAGVVERSAVVLQALDEILGVQRRLADGLGVLL